MKTFDLIVIGGGSGLNVMSAASMQEWKVAIIEQGPMGGTCLNRGCIPSKILIHRADLVEEIKNADKFFIDAEIKGHDFGKMVRETNNFVDEDAQGIEEGIKNDPDLTLFKGTAEFTGKKTLKVNGEEITAPNIVIAAGTRPQIIPIDGLEGIPYWTSTEALRQEKQPATLLVAGGGYIATELAHFYGGMGTKIIMVQRNVRLLPHEDQELGDIFTKEFSKKHTVHLQHVFKNVKREGNKVIATIEKKNGGGEQTVEADALFMAYGRVSNTDILNVEKTGVTLDKKGYVAVNDYMETNIPGIWALGDIAGKHFFKHSANVEARIVSNNLLNPKNKQKVDYTAMPHAVFSNPQIAGVGYTEQELKEKGMDYAVGKLPYLKTGMGKALKEEAGLVKVYADKKTRKILGCHIIGKEASTLIHEVLVAIKYADAKVEAITDTIHIHPALNEVVQRAFQRIEW
jgi:mycothione reductase